MRFAKDCRLRFIAPVSALLLGCISASTGAPFEFQLLTNGLSSPVAITHAGDGSGRLFITEQTGRIRIWDGTQLLSTPFLDVTSLVACCGEQGLLSVAFHPGYKTNGLFYVNYTRRLDGATVIASYSNSVNPNIASTNATILLTIPQPFANHNGGQLQFGPDGYLYIGMGDGGDAGDPLNNAQNLNSLLGKMLRIDVDHGSPYAIPPTNPFVGSTNALPEIWAYGLRNPWRFTFDRFTGDLFIGDVGQNTYEEVDFQPASSTGGENYGWRLMEGFHCFNPPTNCNDGTLTLPILEYDHSSGNCSITGGYRYRGTRMPQFYGTYFYGDYCSGRIWGATQNGTNWTTTELTNTIFSITTFGEDESGELYFSHYATNGTIYRITSTIYPPGDLNGDRHVTGADSLLINQTLVGLRNTNDPIFAKTGFQNGDVNQNGFVAGDDSLLINQVMVGLRSYVATKILPGSHASNQTTAVTIFGVGFPTNTIPGVTIGSPVNLSLSNVVVISREQIIAEVPPGGGLGTGTVNVISTPTNGVISFGRFINQ